MTDLKQQPDNPEQNIEEQLSQNNKFNPRSHNYRNKNNSREERRKRNQQVWKEKKIMSVGNLRETVTESVLGELFSLRTTNYLKNNCSIEMSKLQQNGRQWSWICFSTLSSFWWVCKIHGLEFHGFKIFTEEAETPLRTFVNKLLTNAVASDQSMHKMRPTINDVRSGLPAARTKNNIQFRTLTVHFPMQLYQRKKTALFSDRIPRGMKRKQLNSQVKEGRIHLKAFPGAKSNQLNHYVIPTLGEFD